MDLPTVREGLEEAARLKNRLSKLVNLAYELLWSTAPPRMPGG